MIKEIEKAIEEMAKTASRNDISATEAMQFTQALLNATNALVALKSELKSIK